MKAVKYMRKKIMKILVLNCGSSSLKYQLINMETEEVLASGKYERIGEAEAFITHKVNGRKIEIKKPAYDHKEAIEFTLEQFTNPEYKVIDSLDEIEAIGHRVVHGGEIFKKSALINEKVMEQIAECGVFAPLHNPAAILGMKACMNVMPGKPMVAVFDTTFHQTMPKEKYIYPIPYEYYEKYGVRKYGAHGTSHMYVSQRLAEIVEKDVKDLKIVTCHIGQGSSICAVKDGKSLDTSMGLTPLGGIPMVTRSGDLDPSVLTYLMKKEELEALIKSTVTEAVKPIQEEIETLKKSENDDTAGKGAAGDTGTGEADQNDGTGTGDDTGESDLTGEQIAEVIKSTVAEVVKPIQADIQMLKSVGIMRANTEPGISKIEKEQSPFDGSFVPGSLD